jgi:hypothetical protein
VASLTHRMYCGMQIWHGDALCQEMYDLDVLLPTQENISPCNLITGRSFCYPEWTSWLDPHAGLYYKVAAGSRAVTWQT